MKKNIEISLELAQKIWRNPESSSEMRAIIGTNFTKEELEGTALEIGKWYKGPEKCLACYMGGSGFGFDTVGSWGESIYFGDKRNFSPATTEELEKALIAEAISRGFVQGVRFKSAANSNLKCEVKGDILFRIVHNFKLGFCLLNPCMSDGCIFDGETGKWADILPEEKKGFTWEESFNCAGAFIDDRTSIVKSHSAMATHDCNKAVFKTQKQAFSALAFAQLSHIVAKYNEGKEPGGRWKSFIYVNASRCLEVGGTNKDEMELCFYLTEDAYTSLEVNKELWEQYWMI